MGGEAARRRILGVAIRTANRSSRVDRRSTGILAGTIQTQFNSSQRWHELPQPIRYLDSTKENKSSAAGSNESILARISHEILINHSEADSFVVQISNQPRANVADAPVFALASPCPIG